MKKIRQNKRGKSEQLLIGFRHYVDTKGGGEAFMYEAAQWLLNNGYPPPRAKAPVEILAEQLARVVRSQKEYDPDSGAACRTYHPIPDDHQPGLFKWAPLEYISRPAMQKSTAHRRNQMVNDGVQLILDLRTLIEFKLSISSSSR